jgi:hypothetical protein
MSEVKKILELLDLPHKTQTRENKNGLKKLTTEVLHQAGYLFIHAMRDTNAKTMTLKLKNVTYKGEIIGSYKITVEEMSLQQEVEDKLTKEELRIYSIIKNGAIDNTISYELVYDKDEVNLTSALNKILKSLVKKKLIEWESGEEEIRLVL